MQDTSSSPKQSKPGRARRIFRLLLRLIRVTLVLGLLLSAVLVWYVHEIGLPGMIKARVIAKVRAVGWNLDFSRVRLQGWDHFVADDVQLARSGKVAGPELLARELQLKLQYYREKGWHYKLRSISLDDATLLYPASLTNAHSRYILLNGLAGAVNFQDNDTWELASLQGVFGNINFQISGDLTHASEINQLKLPSAAQRPGQAPLSRALDFLKQIQLSGSPASALHFHADAREIRNSGAQLTLKFPIMQSRWGALSNLTVEAQTAPPPGTNAPFTAKVQANCGSVSTKWGQSGAAQLGFDLQFSPAGTLTNSTILAELSKLHTPWATTAVLRAQAALQPGANTEQRVNTKLSLTARDLSARWGRGAQAEWRTTGSLPPITQLFSTNTVWSRHLQAMLLTNELNINNLTSAWFASDHVSLSTDWKWPQLQALVTGGIQGGVVAAAAGFNVTNRSLVFRSTSDLDLQPFLPRILSTNLQLAVAEYSGSFSPKLQIQGQTILPPWTNRPFWKPQLPQLTLAGHFDLGPGSYHQVAFNGLESSLSLTNQVLRLNGLNLSRPEGVLRAEFVTDFKDSSFVWNLTSNIDPKVARNFFSEPEEREIFDDLEFTVPPFVKGEISGAWNDPRLISFSAQTRITNFAFRGESVSSFAGGIHYSNDFLSFFAPVLSRPEGQGSASSVVIDFSRLLLSITNAETTLDPMAIARVIGPNAVKALQPYRFDSPPAARVNGVVDLKPDSARNDIHFTVRGGSFAWTKLRLQKVAGLVDWVGDTLSLSNIQGDFNTGRLDGGARIDFSPKAGAEFSAQANLVEADLHEFLANWSSATNHIEGRFNGQLNITSGNTDLPKTWQGYGWLSLRDGLLWDIPMFGLFSMPLNAFVPGLGNSRARKASATFLITNGVVSTPDLEIHATAMRMLFHGTVDFDQVLDARVEAELLRDVPAVGPLVSKVLWPITKLFEYKLIGTLGKPKSEPVYVLPKVLMVPMHPIKSFKELMKPPAGPDEK